MDNFTYLHNNQAMVFAGSTTETEQQQRESFNTNTHTTAVAIAATSHNDADKVVHTYHDWAALEDGDIAAGAAHQLLLSSDGGGGDSNGGGTVVEQSFPVRLHYMLQDIEKDGMAHIVSWQVHGRCFLVHNHKLFVEKILGSWFRQSKIASFQRQLNIYGFKRITQGRDKGGYYHEYFLRSKPGLAARIQRFKLKGTKTRKAANPETEPNFYAMEPLPSNNAASNSGGNNKVQPTTTHPGISSTHSSQGSGLLTGGCDSSNLTLQRLAPALFSPATFKTSIQWGTPQLHNPSLSRVHQGLTVTSTCSLSLKPSAADDNSSSRYGITNGINYSGLASAAGASRPSVLSLATNTAANPFCTLQANPLFATAAASSNNSRSNNDAFWAALNGGGSILPVSLGDRDITSGNDNGQHFAPSSSLWLLR